MFTLRLRPMFLSFSPSTFSQFIIQPQPYRILTYMVRSWSFYSCLRPRLVSSMGKRPGTSGFRLPWELSHGVLRRVAAYLSLRSAKCSRCVSLRVHEAVALLPEHGKFDRCPTLHTAFTKQTSIL